MNEAPETFWMVYGLDQGAPTARHSSRSRAEDEARRLARNCPGIKFFVLETVACAEKIDVVFIRHKRLSANGIDDSDLPF